ncbi:MAG: hypothetical protein WB441_15960 [Nocardioidaceae bacterium]
MSDRTRTYRPEHEMTLIYEDLARAQLDARLDEARKRRRVHAVVLARRLSAKAERAALEARLAIARTL